MSDAPYHVGLFVTCLVNSFRPQVGLAAVKLLEDNGCRVTVPSQQTCCGQPAYNSGDRVDTKSIATQVITAFEAFDYVVVPSGSCGGMIAKHYCELFVDDDQMRQRADHLAQRTYELTAFLVDVLKVDHVAASYPHSVAYHDSCAGLRELGIKQQPRKLLDGVNGIEQRSLKDSEVCCGFGGTFCVKYSEISNKIVSDKADCIRASDADTLLAGDLGCLMNIAGKLQRRGDNVKVRHVAEVLANMSDIPAIGEVDETDQ